MKTWCRLVAAMALMVTGGWAVDWKTLKPQGYVSDFAGVVDPTSRARLETYGAQVEKATGVQMALVTIRSLEGEPIEDVANTIFRAWGVGQKGKNEGMMLLLAVNDRRSRLEVGYGLEPIIPDGLAGSMLREMRPALRRGDYGDALVAAAETIGTAIAQAKHVAIVHGPPRRVVPSSGESIPWPLIIGGLVLLGWLMRSGGTRGYGGYGGGGGFLPGVIIGSTMGRGTWGSRSGGGFGGYDSGDSFGGFGGGDSGGGGASSDW
ncbi:MAG TPA: TPM domain-containing protein [Bryobacteraceae bacterium]|nr:TPM domain-containing protein [Bryobacteraceae bacterium]